MPESGDLQSNGYFDMDQQSWTDAIPVCNLTGVGFASNQVYQRNGYRSEAHPFEDRSFHFKVDDNTSFYAIFDGHKGTKASQFTALQLPTEIILGQLATKNSDEEIKDLLVEAFEAVEKAYFVSNANLIAEKTSLEMRIQGMTRYEAATRFPDIVERLNAVNEEVSAGTTAVVALVHKNKLYLANVGDSRALLCRTDSFGGYTTQQLTADHDLKNDDELRRLSKMGLNVDTLINLRMIGNQPNTRCIGNYLVKGGHKDFEYLATATEEPVMAIPEVRGGIEIDDTCQFLVLMSDGLYNALEESTGTTHVNSDIVQMIVEEFKTQSNLSSVAQTVVHRVCRMHQEQYFASLNEASTFPKCYQSIGDITLLVRNFNHPLVHGNQSPGGKSPGSTTFRKFEQLKISISEEDEFDDHPDHRNLSASGTLQVVQPNSPSTVVDYAHNNYTTDTTTNTATTTTESSSEFEERGWESRQSESLELDEEGRVASYVNFDVFYRNIQEAKASESLLKEKDL